MTMYLDFVLEQDTVACFLELHDSRFQPRKTQYPNVDQQSFGHPAQSEYAIISLKKRLWMHRV
jgi:hypothetical protein